MNLVLTVIDNAAPVFRPGAVGALQVRGPRWEHPLECVSRLAMTVAVAVVVAMPALAFAVHMRAEAAPRALADLSLAALAAKLLAALAFRGVSTVRALGVLSHSLGTLLSGLGPG